MREPKATLTIGYILSEEEAERYLDRLDTLMEFAKLFDYEEPSDRAIAIVSQHFLIRCWVIF